MKRRMPYGGKLPVKFTLSERDLIRDETFCDPNFAESCVEEGKGIRVDLSLDDIEDLQGHVAAAANHTEDKKLQQKLDRVLDKLQTLLDTYDDQDEGNIIPFRPAEPFTEQAKARWNKIPESVRPKILNSVYCGHCQKGVPIVLQTAKMEKRDLILRGKCGICGHEVCRSIEPEKD